MADVATDFVREVYSYRIQGLESKTEDLVCTTDGGPTPVRGRFWWLVGKVIPGDVDHIAVYIGPQGRCVEASAKGRVAAFDVPAGTWDAALMFPTRGIEDTLYGIGDPLAGRNLSPEQESRIRVAVANFCLAHAAKATRYNLNFFNPNTEQAFYCSQLAYRAYLPHAIDLSANREIRTLPVTRHILFPQDVWAACGEKRKAER